MNTHLPLMAPLLEKVTLQYSIHSCLSQDTYLRTKEIRDRVSRNNIINRKRP